MVVGAAKRRRRYKAKLGPGVVHAQISKQRKRMIDAGGSKFVGLVQVENSVRRILEGQAISTIMFPAYMDFGRECSRVTQKLSQETAAGEVRILYDKWASRGLIKDKLAEIAALFGITVVPPPPGELFKLDLGRLDIDYLG